MRTTIWHRSLALILGTCVALGTVLTLQPPAKAGEYKCKVRSSAIKQCFPDPELAKVVAFEMQKSVDDVPTQTQYDSISTLNGVGAGIADLQGLDNKFMNLEILLLSHNRITCIGPLAVLSGLTSLELRDNQVADVGPLKDLTNLTTLYLERNKIRDVSPLAGLVNLRRRQPFSIWSVGERAGGEGPGCQCTHG